MRLIMNNCLSMLLWNETERVLYFRTTECHYKIASKRHRRFGDIESLKSRDKYFLNFIINRKAKASEVYEISSWLCQHVREKDYIK